VNARHGKALASLVHPLLCCVFCCECGADWQSAHAWAYPLAERKFSCRR